MIPVLAPRLRPVYSRGMPAVIVKLLTLLALALMPFGMSATSSAAVHHAPAGAAAPHCDEQDGQPAKTSPDQTLNCAMTCSMLVAAEARVEEPAPSVRQAAGRKPAERATGLHPDTVTPPPKLS